MAIIKKNILGDISGRLGSYTYRVRNGKLVKYRRPVKQRISHSKDAVSARKDFAMTVKLAAFINNFPALKRIWKNANVPGSNHYQKMIKNNSAAVKLFGISARNIITPPGIGFEVNSLSVTCSKINFIIPVNSFELKKLFSQPAVMHIIFYFYAHKSKSVPSFCFNGLITELPCTLQDNNYGVNLVPNDETSRNLKKYSKTVLYFSAASLNPGSEKIFWTSTFASEINF